MWVDAWSVTLRALSFIGLFQASGSAMLIALFGGRVPDTARGQGFLLTQHGFEA